VRIERRVLTSVKGFPVRLVPLIPLFLAALLTMPAIDAGAAIDCSRATGNVDRMLCSNSRAAAAEERMAQAFRAAVRRGVAPDALRSSQVRWKTQVRDLCNTIDCLIKAYDQRIVELDSMGAS
jgi:uncharacterized protein